MAIYSAGLILYIFICMLVYLFTWEKTNKSGEDFSDICLLSAVAMLTATIWPAMVVVVFFGSCRLFSIRMC